MLRSLTAEQVRTLAPDGAASRAGEALATLKRWPASGRSASAAWGLCQGSSSAPYQVTIDLEGPAYRCSCPSPKVPCKHSLGLLFLLAGGDVQRVAELLGSGVAVVVLLALSDRGAPAFDHALAAKLAALGAPAFACTPDRFPELMAAVIEHRDIGRWAAEQGIVAERPAEG